VLPKSTVIDRKVLAVNKATASQGLPAKVVQQLLGHSSIVMTMDTYGHLYPADDDVHTRSAESAGALLDAT
jgi:integrase